MDLHRLKKTTQFDTAGWIAISSLLMCSVSGAILAIPYDFVRAYQSIYEILLFNPVASFVRNFHYWSAQLFFVFTLLHIGDHLWKSTESNIRNNRTWLILSMVILFLGYAMISGFILKGDAAGNQARRIISSMLESVPFAGKMLSSAFTGSEENWQVVYVQHIATGTIFLFMGVYEHLRSIWPKLKTFVILFVLLVIVSLLFRAPFGLAESNQLKGPWFFVGIQEMLHFTSHPGYIVLFFAFMLMLFFMIPRLTSKYRTAFKRLLFGGSILYFAVTMMVLFFRGDNWEWRGMKEFTRSNEQILVFDPVNILKEAKFPILPENQKTEGCLLCHGSMTGLTDAHNPAAMGCYACHLGDPFTSDKALAHSKMVKVPGDFSNVRQTCGTQNCHPEISDRIMNSLMTTQSGIVAVDKYVFGEAGSPDGTFHIKNLAHTAADTHLRNLCAGCHLGKEKSKTGNATWLDRGGGCNACHLHYTDQSTASMNRMQEGKSVNTPEIHPAIDMQVSNDRCKSCHSRSGRISLNYEGWNESELKATETNVSDSLMVLPDERVLRFVQADIHHQKGMACIDCHNSYELMGDGKHHIHKEDAVNIQCVDCHSSGKTNSILAGDLPDRESQLIAGLRKISTKEHVVLTSEGARPLLNTKIDSAGQILLTDKLHGRTRVSKPVSPACKKGQGHSRLSCEACHSAWVPQCIGCHNSFEKGTAGFDLLNGSPTTGTWVEFAGKSYADPPVLGVSDKSGGRIVTTMPGMIMTIDHASFAKDGGKSFHRLYAPASAHTTRREGRSCKSCHNNPLAIGYGRGELHYEVSGSEGRWRFDSRFALSAQDGLPEDAWIGFLKEPVAPYATRSDLRPFSVKEQHKILQVGSCLTCHDEKSNVMERTLVNYEQTLAARTVKCIRVFGAP